MPFFIKPITRTIGDKIVSEFLAPQFETHFSFLESQLKTSGGNYLCGKNLTGADILMSFPLIAAKERAIQSDPNSKEKYPNLIAYIERIEKEPGYVKAVDKIVEIDGKFEAMLSV